MRAYSSMPVEELIDQIRDIAIRASASPLVIDKLDELLDLSDADQIEKDQREAVEAAENDAREEQWNTCYDTLCDRLADDEIGLTETQIEQIKEIMMQVKP